MPWPELPSLVSSPKVFWSFLWLFGHFIWVSLLSDDDDDDDDVSCASVAPLISNKLIPNQLGLCLLNLLTRKTGVDHISV